MVKLSLPRFWSPSSRSSLRLKEEKAPAVALEVPASSVGLEGADLARALGAVGAGVEAEDLAGVLFGEASCSRGRTRR